MMNSENPYQPYAESYATNPVNVANEMRLSLLTHIRIVSITLIVHGAMLVMMGAFLIAMAFYMPQVISTQQNQMQQRNQQGPNPAQLQTILLATYSTMGVAGFIPGVLQVIAGILNVQLKRRKFGIAALLLGLLSVGTCYCAPTSIILCAYGLYVFFSETARTAYALGAEGKTFSEIEQMAR